jgi:hypothetical protein
LEKIATRKRNNLFPFLSDEEHAVAVKILRKSMYWMLKRTEKNISNPPKSETISP